MKKAVIALVIGLAILIWMAYASCLEERSPLEVVNRNRDTKDSAFQVARVLHESPVADNKYLILYLNPAGKVCNVLLEKGKLGYSVVDFNGEIATKNDVIPAGMYFGWYRQEEGWVGYGVLYDHRVKTVIIDGEMAKIVQAEDLRLWYLFGERRLDETRTVLLDDRGEAMAH